MLPASAILENFAVLALLVIWNTFFKWEIAELDCFWHRTEYCFKKIARKSWKTQGSAKKRRSRLLIYLESNTSETVQPLKSHDILYLESS